MELKPSGYQIINIGSIDLSSTVTISKGTEEWADILIELGLSGKLADKPILLSLINTDADEYISGFCTLKGTLLTLTVFVGTQYANVYIEVGSDYVQIDFYESE